MSGLRKSSKVHTKWLLGLTAIILIILVYEFYVKPKKENYTELHRRLRFLEIGLCVDVPSAECRPSLGQQCTCD